MSFFYGNFEISTVLFCETDFYEANENRRLSDQSTFTDGDKYWKLQLSINLKQRFLEIESSLRIKEMRENIYRLQINRARVRVREEARRRYTINHMNQQPRIRLIQYLFPQSPRRGLKRSFPMVSLSLP